jgi:superfamily II DNA helicase RecQ
VTDGIVISPLIALMQDQGRSPAQLGVRAEYLNQPWMPRTAGRVERELLAGELDMLYVAPERLLTEPLALAAVAQPDRPVRHRRALRVAVGPRLPANTAS